VSPRKIWIASFCLLSIVLISIAAWAGRLMMYPDGISYLDMADKLRNGDASPLLNAYWSPLYPCLLALMFKAFPDPAIQFQAAHFVNWLIGIGALASFTFFLISYLYMKVTVDSLSSFRCRTAFAYALFLWGALEAIGLAGVGADLCVMALVFLAAGLCCRLQSSSSLTAALLLAVTLSLACFSKAALIPLSMALYVLLALSRRMRMPLLAASGVAFIVLLGPYVTALSLQEHHFTIGESGKLNYAWQVLKEAPQSAGWRDTSTEAGTPLHAPLLLNVDPPVIAFAGPISDTNALWYDPVYFYEGLRVRFDLRKQIATLIHSALAMRPAAGTILFPLVAGLFVLGCRVTFRRVIDGLSKSIFLYWAIAAFGLYSLVVVESRYIAAFLVLFWFVLYESLASLPLRSWSRAAIAATAVCILLFQNQGVLKAAGDSVTGAKAAAHFTAAKELMQLGLKPGDSIATVGSGFDAFYAKLAQLRIVANVGYLSGPDPIDKQFRPLDDTTFAPIVDKLRPLQIKAVVGPCAYLTTGMRWARLGDSGFCATVF